MLHQWLPESEKVSHCVHWDIFSFCSRCCGMTVMKRSIKIHNCHRRNISTSGTSASRTFSIRIPAWDLFDFWFLWGKFWHLTQLKVITNRQAVSVKTCFLQSKIFLRPQVRRKWCLTSGLRTKGIWRTESVRFWEWIFFLPCSLPVVVSTGWQHDLCNQPADN